MPYIGREDAVLSYKGFVHKYKRRIKMKNVFMTQAEAKTE